MSDKKKLAWGGVITLIVILCTWLFLRTPDAVATPIRFMPLANSVRSGYIPATFSINESGTPSYQIEIEVPPGTNDVAPALSINYSDIRSNGILGMGWDLIGLSVITRTGEIIPQDGIKTGITFTNADRFTLNSQRLVAFRNASGKLLTTIADRNAAYGQNGTEYRTEVESWSRIYSYGNVGTGPAYFIVYSKDGSVMQFGNTADSRIQPSGAPAVTAWGLNKIQDNNGNYVAVVYTPESQKGDALPKSISYTGNARGNLAPQRMVQFNYALRSDTLVNYYNGVKFSTPYLISSLQTFVDQDGDGNNINIQSNLVKKYSFTYTNSQSTGRSLLDSLVVTDAAGNALPATHFQWNSFDIKNTFSDTLTPLPANFQRVLLGQTKSVRADFTGDGLLDIALLEYESDSILIASVTNPCVVKTFNWAAPSNFQQYINAPNSQTLAGDYNGDGLTDIAFFQKDQTILPVMITLPSGGFTGKIIPIPSNVQQLLYGNPNVTTGDFNGDGLTDITAFQGGKQTLPLLLMTSTLTFTGIAVTLPANVAPYINAAGAKQQIGDFNGDGLSDICSFVPNAQSLPMLFSNGSNGFNSTLFPFPAAVKTIVNANGANQVEGDFNGDGLSDFAIFLNGLTSVPVIYSRGDGNFNSTTFQVPAGTFNGSNAQQVAGDINGDGVTDLTAYSNGFKSIPSLISTGGGRFTYNAQPLSDAVGQYLNAASVSRFVADFNGDGMLDISALKTGFTQLPVLVVNNISDKNNVPDLMIKTVDGLGASTSMDYKPLTDQSVYTGSSAGFTYPYLSTKFPSYVVSHTRTQDGGNNPTTVLEYDYHYQSAIIDQYRGWQGFAKTFTSDLQNHTMVTSIHLCSFPYSGITSQERVADLEDTTKLMEVVSFNYQSAYESGTSVSQIWNAQITKQHYTLGHLNYTHWQNFEFDAQHRVITRIADVKNNSGDSGIVYTKFQYNFNPPADSLWWQAFYPQQQKVSGDSCSTCWSSWSASDYSWMSYTYDSRMNITKNRGYLDNNGTGTGSWVGTSLRYDVYGNQIISKTPPNYSADSITAQVFYDSIYHSFAVKNIYPDPLPGQNNPALISYTAYDPRFGSIIEETNANGQTAYYIPSQGMDGMGRVLITQSNQPHSTALATRFVYSYGNTGNGYTITAQQPTTWTSSTTPDTTWLSQTAYYDGFARNTKTVSNGYAPNVQLVERQGYNLKGQLTDSYEAYYYSTQNGIQYQPGGATFNAALTFKQQYDKYGILQEMRAPDPLKPTGDFVTERTVYDSTDNRIAYTWKPSPANDSVFIYWKKEFSASGNLKKKSGPYNANGSQGENYSEISYKYDPIERLIQTIDPLNEKIITSYNSMGNVLYSYRPETDTIHYIYNNNSWVTKTIDANGQLLYTYDDLGRTLTESQQENGNAVQLIAQNIYDIDSIAPNSIGQVSRTIITQGTYTYGYDVTGALNTQMLFLDSLNKTFTQHFSIDAVGRIDSIIYPDSSAVHYTFDRMGNLNRVLLDGDTLMRYQSYTAAGSPVNTIARNKVASSFSYDNLGRVLTSNTNKDAFTMRSYGYSWSKANKLLGILDKRTVQDSSLSQNFSYYPSGRLFTASGPYGNQSFVYDAAGNRTADQKYTYQYDPVKKHELVSIKESGQQVFGFTYATTGELNSKTVSESFVKKNAATATAGVQVNYTFDQQGNLTQVQGALTGQSMQTVDQFAYDEDGMRLCKRDSDNTVTWYVSPFFEAANVKNGQLVCTKYVYDTQGQVLYSSSAQAGAAEKRRVANALRTRDKKEAGWSWLSPFFHKGDGWAVNLPVYAAYVLLIFVLLYFFRAAQQVRKEKKAAGNRVVRYFNELITYRATIKWKLLFFTALILAAQPASATPVSGPNGPGVPVAGEERFFSHDHLGSTVLLTDANGGLTNSIEYQPFGSIDEQHSTGEDDFRPKYTGKEFDAYTELFYFGGRYYDGDLGRFVSPDDAEQFVSPYAYGNDDPMSGIDPDGNEFVFIVALIVAAIVGAYVGAAIANGSFNPANWEWNSAKTWVGMIAGAAAGVAIVATGGAALAAAGVVAAESVALGSISASTIAFSAIDVAFLTTDAYTFSQDPSVLNGIFVAIDLIPFAAALGRTMKGVNKTRQGIKAGEEGLEKIPRAKEGSNSLEHSLCPLSFAAGTKILTPEGEVDIEDIEVGDLVVAADMETESTGTYAVSRIFKRVAVGLVILVTSAGDSIAVTPEHPVYTLEAGWVEVKDVEPGDHMLSAESFMMQPENAFDADEEISISSSTFIPDTVVTVYNFEVEKVHNYFVSYSHLLVHNPKSCGKVGKGGRHGTTSKNSERKLVESNHFPASASYRGTPYEHISFRDKPAVTMHYSHHRIAKSTGSSHISKAWRAKQTTLLKQRKFAAAMKMDILDMLGLDKSALLKTGIRDAINYTFTLKVGTTPLISATERAELLLLAK